MPPRTVIGLPLVVEAVAARPRPYGEDQQHRLRIVHLLLHHRARQVWSRWRLIGAAWAATMR